MVKAQFGPKGTCRAMVVGISEYQDPDIPDLHFAHRDAKAFAQYLQTRPVDKVKPENLKLLTNNQATGGNVHSALRNLVKDSQTGDKVVIYFAGHGDVETLYPDEPGHLLVFDTPANNYSSNSLRLDDIRRTVNALVSRDIQVLIVTDACHAGKLAGSAVNGSQAATSSMAEQFNSEIKILSCQSNEYSQEGEQWGDGRGVFSWYLIQGLTGMADTDKDLQVTIKELSRYLEDMIEPDVSPQRQTPNLVGDRNARVAVIDEAQLLALRKELDPNFSSSDPIIASREPDTPPTERIDSVWIKKINAFQQAINNKKLIAEDLGPEDPKGISAYDQLQKLKKEDDHQKEVVKLEDQLIAKLQEDAQQAINAYLKNDQEELMNRWKGTTGSYLKYPSYLKTAASMLDKDQYLRNRLFALAHYFQAISLRISNDKELHENSDLLQLALLQTDSALLFEPRAAFIQNEIGLIHFRLKHYSTAISHYLNALEVAPSWAMPYNNLAITYSVNGDLDKAEDWANKALQRDSSLFGSYNVLAEYYLQKKQNMLAEAAHIEAIRRNPSISQPLMNYGSYWVKINRPEMAEIWYQQVLVKSPVQLNHLNDIADYYIKRSDMDRGRYYYQEILKRDSSSVLAWNGIGTVYLRKNELPQAKSTFEKAYSLNKQFLQTLTNLGLTAFMSGDLSSSKEHYQKALNVFPDSIYCPAYGGLGAVLLAQGLLTESESILMTMLNVCKDDPTAYSAWYNLACARALSGKKDLAFEALENAILSGFNQFNHIQTDPDLQTLHEMPQWQALSDKYFK